ncbi:MAG TPA: hypothetical protein ENI87_11745, partial [bacterium]|nr:hypothetical protein [bacterium]
EADPDPQAETRRKQAHDSIARFLRIPGSTELDIAVDTDEDQVRFLIRDRDTGELIREVPEDESGPLVGKLREYVGALLDRSV